MLYDELISKINERIAWFDLEISRTYDIYKLSLLTYVFAEDMSTLACMAKQADELLNPEVVRMDAAIKRYVEEIENGDNEDYI